MKIKKGYTREQFIDLINKRSYQKYTKFYDDFNDFSISNLGLIYRYNKRLKQPLKKEMFVNEKIKPLYGEDMLSQGQLMREWKGSESKVVFKGWTSPTKNNVVEKESFRKFETISFYSDYCYYYR